MFPALMLYLLMGMIIGSLVFKIVYSLYNSVREGFGNNGMQPLVKIKEIVGGITCPKGFLCATLESDPFFKTEDSGVTSLLVCVEKKMRACTFARTSGERFLCKCPLRLYLNSELKK
jgi:hypothetical protein